MRPHVRKETCLSPLFGLLAPLLRQGKGDLGGTPPETIMAPIMFSEDLLEAAPPRRLDHVLLPCSPAPFCSGRLTGTLIGPFLASLDDLEALLWPNFRVISAPGDLGPLSELGLLAGMSLQTIRKTWGLERIQDLDDEMAEAHLASALIYPLEISTPGSSRLDWPGPPYVLLEQTGHVAYWRPEHSWQFPLYTTGHGPSCDVLPLGYVDLIN